MGLSRPEREAIRRAAREAAIKARLTSREVERGELEAALRLRTSAKRSGAPAKGLVVIEIADSIEPLAQAPKHQSEPGSAAAEPQSIASAIRPPFVSSPASADSSVLRVPSDISVMTGAQLASLACKTLHSLEIPTDALVARCAEI